MKKHSEYNSFLTSVINKNTNKLTDPNKTEVECKQLKDDIKACEVAIAMNKAISHYRLPTALATVVSTRKDFRFSVPPCEIQVVKLDNNGEHVLAFNKYSWQPVSHYTIHPHKVVHTDVDKGESPLDSIQLIELVDGELIYPHCVVSVPDSVNENNDPLKNLQEEISN